MSEPTRAQQLMIDDGLPAAIVLRTTEERRQAWATRPSAAHPAKEIPMRTEPAKPSKSDQVAALRVRRAEAKGNLAAALGRPLTPKTPSAKKAKAAKPPKAPAKAKKAAPASKAAKGSIRPGSKLEIVVGLLTRKEGCTSADVCEATGWGAVSIPPIARRAGIKIAKTKDGTETRYRIA